MYWRFCPGGREQPGERAERIVRRGGDSRLPGGCKAASFCPAAGALRRYLCDDTERDRKGSDSAGRRGRRRQIRHPGGSKGTVGSREDASQRKISHVCPTAGGGGAESLRFC